MRKEPLQRAVAVVADREVRRARGAPLLSLDLPGEPAVGLVGVDDGKDVLAEKGQPPRVELLRLAEQVRLGLRDLLGAHGGWGVRRTTSR